MLAGEREKRESIDVPAGAKRVRDRWMVGDSLPWRKVYVFNEQQYENNGDAIFLEAKAVRIRLLEKHRGVQSNFPASSQ